MLTLAYQNLYKKKKNFGHPKLRRGHEIRYAVNITSPHLINL